MSTERKLELRCPRCGATAAVRVQRAGWERYLKPWRADWQKFECDICYHCYWVRGDQHKAAAPAVSR